VPTTPGLEVHTIADLNPEGAKEACRNVDWTDELIVQTLFIDDAMAY
jgi:predicted homoserine dehydrogenase-like protein